MKIGIVSASGGTPRWVSLPGDPRNTYVPRMEWVDATGELMLQQLNRLQNTNDVWLADANPRPTTPRGAISTGRGWTAKGLWSG